MEAAVGFVEPAQRARADEEFSLVRRSQQCGAGTAGGRAGHCAPLAVRLPGGVDSGVVKLGVAVPGIFAARPLGEETVAATRAGTEKMVVGSVLGGWGGERRPHIVNTEVLST